MKMAMKAETNENLSKNESVWHHVGKPAKPPSRSDAAMAMLVTSPSRRGTAIHSQASQVTRRQRSRAPVLVLPSGPWPIFSPQRVHSGRRGGGDTPHSSAFGIAGSGIWREKGFARGRR